MEWNNFDFMLLSSCIVFTIAGLASGSVLATSLGWQSLLSLMIVLSIKGGK